MMSKLRHLALCPLLSMSLAVTGCQPDATTPATGTRAASPAYAAVARGRVDVEGGLLQLGTSVGGAISHLAIHEGEHVHAGQTLATLDSVSAQEAVAQAVARLTQSEAREKVLKVRFDAARTRASRLAAAAAAGAGDGQSADDARTDGAQLAAQIDAAHAASDLFRSELAQARHHLEQHTLSAPLDADVIRIDAQPGENVSKGSSPLFTLLPSGPRIIRAELDEAFVDSVHPGMHAELVDENNPNSSLGNARVLRIGLVYGPSTLEDDPALRNNSRTVECVLDFDQSSQLLVGQQVLVRFLPAPRGGP